MARNAMDAATEEIRAALKDDPTLRELAKSNRLLANAALVKARGYDPENAEDDDEWDDEEENDEDEYDEDEDEDQDADDPDSDSGIDDERGTVGRTKKSRRIKKSKGEAAEDELVRAKLRLKKAEKDEDEAEDEDERRQARKSRKRAEKELNRARGKLHRAKPAWVGDEDEEAEDSRRRRGTAQEWYRDSEDAYFTNEDADHEEDGSYPPDGPEVADGNDTDQYTIGAHKVRSQRAMRRSRQGVPSKQALHKSMAADGRLTEELLDAAPALELIAEVLGDQQGDLAKSAQMLGKHDRILGALAQTVVAQNKVLHKMAKSLAVVEHQVPSSPMFGMPPAFGVVAGGQSKKGAKLQKSRAEVLLEAEDAMNRGLIDGATYTAMGRAPSTEDAVGLVPPVVQAQLGWK